eukprot:scaffold294377_cov27-Tisochrysis_lutea.AAC.2
MRRADLCDTRSHSSSPCHTIAPRSAGGDRTRLQGCHHGRAVGAVRLVILCRFRVQFSCSTQEAVVNFNLL